MNYLLAIIAVFLIPDLCPAVVIEMYAQKALKVKANFSDFQEPTCFNGHGYLPMREEIAVGGRMEVMGEPIVPVELYLELENKSLRLFCVIDFLGKPCSRVSGCDWKNESSNIYSFRASFLAIEAMNKSTIVATTRAMNRHWYPVMKNIKVLPAPKMFIYVGKVMVAYLRPCVAAVRANSDVVVRFCVRELRHKVFLALAPADAPLVFENQSDCITKEYKIGTENLTLQMSYKGGCHQLGSITCNLTSGEIFTTTKNTTVTTITTTTVATAPEGESSLKLIFWIFIALISIAAASFLMYTCFIKQKSKKPKKSLGGMSKPGDDDSSSSESN